MSDTETPDKKIQYTDVGLRIKFMTVREMRSVRTQIEEKSEIIPSLEQKLRDTRAERLQLLAELDALEQFAESNDLRITPEDVRPVVNGESRAPISQAPISQAPNQNDEALQLIIDLRRVVGMFKTAPSAVRQKNAEQIEKVIKHADLFIVSSNSPDDDDDDDDL